MILANLFYDLRALYRSIGNLFLDSSRWCEGNDILDGLVDPLYDVAQWFFDLSYICMDIGQQLDSWWDKLTGACSDIIALNLDVNNVITWIQGIPGEIRNYIQGKVNDTVNWVKSIPGEISAYVQNTADEIKTWVNSVLPDILEWVRSHAVEVYEAIKGFIVEFVFIAQSYANDIWDAVVGFTNDIIASALSPFAEIYNWFELQKDLVKGFFDDPLTYILNWLESIVSSHEIQILSIADKIGDVLFHKPDDEE